MKNFTLCFVLVTIFAMVTTATVQQPFVTDENGEVSALTPHVRSLMEHADEVIVETAKARLIADRKVVEAENALKKVLADKNASAISIVIARATYIGAIMEAKSARLPVGEATHKVAMAYFQNVQTIVDAGCKLAADNYRQWQDRTLSVQHPGNPPGFNALMDESMKAMEKAREREKKNFDRLLADFEELAKPK